ncbi:MAG: FHA domain-containing protein [Anaerolineae bacterium]|nr:FHA domain-containing protein [Anaerolineae bacterium]
MDDATVHVDDVGELSDKHLIVSWPGHQMMAPLARPEVRLGRSREGNQIVINYPVVSRYHATLKWEKGGYHIVDGQVRNGEHQPSTNGLYFRGKRITKRKLENGDIIRVPDRNENFITLMYFDRSAAPPAEIERVRLGREISLGRDKRNAFPLHDPTISRFHATISPAAGKGHILRDLNSQNGTYVNGQRISRVELHENDVIQIGSIQLRYDGLQLIPADLRREGIRLEAIAVRKQVKVKKVQPTDTGYKILLDDVSLAVHPREFVAIVGGSGAGKSTMLDALNGFRPAEGQVLINGDDLYQNFDAYRQSIGYVPQDDIIHRELTVAEALQYVALLRLPPDTPDEEIKERIDDVLEQVAMSDKKNLLIRQLSGGQRKRVSIAVELIADPGILFLDEPTSGLDPGLDKKMMFTLKQVANSGKTVILVTHATGNIAECDLVAFLAVGGRLVFYGPPKDALSFFEVDDFAEIYNKVEQEPDKWFDAFQASTYYELYVQKRLGPACPHCGSSVKAGQKFCNNCGHKLATAGDKEQVKRGAARKRGDSLPKKMITALRQMVILSRRYLTMLVRDRRNFLFLLLQSPIIALLLFLVIDPGLFGKGIETEVNDVAAIQKILFVLACVATWFGIINSVREIVKELPIYRRERLVNLSVSAYVFSKLVVLLGLSLVQSFLLVLIVHLRSGFPWTGSTFLPGLLEVFVSIVLVTFTSVCFGLFLSAVVGREDRVMSIMPLFLIPQIVFAGIVFALEGGAKVVSWVTFSRWGIEALGSSVNLPELRKLASYSTPVDELPFAFAHTPAYLLQNWAILFGFALLSIILTLVALKRQDVN